jgi:uncharacterized repeat protein (TIGR01451 family)
VTAWPPTGGNVVNHSYVDLTAKHPDIRITKTAFPTTGAPSTNVQFNITVENTGDCTLNPVYVIDTIPAGMNFVSCNHSGVYDNVKTVNWSLGPLNAGTSVKVQVILHVNVNTGILRNWANVTAWPPTGGNVVNHSYVDVNVKYPKNLGICVEKYVKWDCTTLYKKSVDAKKGNYVTFKIYVKNIGETKLDIVVRDKLPTGLIYHNKANHAPTSISRNIITWNFDNVQPQTSIVITFEATVICSGKLRNLVNVTGTLSGYGPVFDEDSATVRVLTSNCYGIHVVKCGPASATVGQVVAYKFTVTNTGTVPLSNIKVIDTVTGVATYVSGDTNKNNKLDVTETWIFTGTCVVAASPDPLVNTVTASGSYGTKTYTDDDCHSLDVLPTCFHGQIQVVFRNSHQMCWQTFWQSLISHHTY